MKKTIFNLIIILVLIFGINYIRAGVLKGKINKINGVMERFYDTRQRSVEVEDDKSKNKYIRNGNFYQLVYEEKNNKDDKNKIANFYYDCESKKGFSVIDGKVNKIDDNKLYLEENKEDKKEKAKEEEKQAEEIDGKINKVKEEHKKKENTAKNLSEVSTKEKDEKEIKNEEEIKENKKTFVEFYTGPKIVEDFAEKAFFIISIKDKEKNENKFMDFAGNYIITDSKTDFVKEIKYNNKMYKYSNYTLSNVEKIKMPKLK